MLSDKKILIAVCGSIAAYKTAFFIRLLKKQGAEVKVIMTKSSQDFITPLTLATLSKHPVYTDFFNSETGDWTNHVELGLWADIFIIAPASANTIAKMAHGICDNLLLATYLSARCPVFIAPAMDLDMYKHPATQNNIKTLSNFGHTVIEPEEGELASGLEGKGRMAEPESLVELIGLYFKKKSKLTGKKILITSGPTYESIDPVRFIGNHSSGKMGKSLADVAIGYGAHIEFISGPVNNYPSHSSLNLHKVTTAEQMLRAVENLYEAADIIIFSAAVADYRPKNILDQKKKRDGHELSIELIENPDIAYTLGKRKSGNKIHVGFALETHDGITYAKEKLRRKNFDLIVLNQMTDEGAGFGHDTNKITILDQNNILLSSELKSKVAIAHDIIETIITLLDEK